MTPSDTIDFWQSPDGSATLYLGEWQAVLARENFAFDAVVTDPPYGINYEHGGGGRGYTGAKPNIRKIPGDAAPFDLAPLLALDGGCKLSAARQKALSARPSVRQMVIFGADHFIPQLPPGGRLLCWDKSLGQGPADCFADAEFAWTNRKNARSVFRHFWKGCFRTGQDNQAVAKRTHPSQKPVELMAWCIETARIGLGKTVFDPYMGTGSTGVAALQCGRRFVGVELDPYWFADAVRRISAQWERMHSQ